MKKCKYDFCWTGQCKSDVVEGEEYCQEHLGKKCWKCDNQAVGDCHKFNGSFVCGAEIDNNIGRNALYYNIVKKGKLQYKGFIWKILEN